MIKRVGNTPPIGNLDGVDKVQGKSTDKAAFSQAGPVERSSVERSSEAQAVQQAVQEVAQRIRAGESLAPADRVDAVVQALVVARLDGATNASEVRERVADAQAVLGAHPAFAGHVHSLLESALAGLD